jgi:hypothetical protein
VVTYSVSETWLPQTKALMAHPNTAHSACLIRGLACHSQDTIHHRHRASFLLMQISHPGLLHHTPDTPDTVKMSLGRHKHAQGLGGPNHVYLMSVFDKLTLLA